MSRNSIVNPWFCRAAGLFLGTSLAISAWAGDTAVTVGNADVTVTGANTTANFPVSRSGDLSFDTYLNFQTQDGSAIAGTDYLPLQGFWLLPAGVANLNIPVTISGKHTTAADKTLFLNMLGYSAVAPVFSLTSHGEFPTGPNPYLIAVADLNGDGKPDLIVADHDSGSVTVLLNTTVPGTSTPSFATGQTFSVASSVFAVAVADMNGDGRPDLAVSDLNDGTVSILLNSTASGAATAEFATAQPFTVPAGSAADMAVADLNGDGKPDLLVGSSTNIVTSFINDTATDATTVKLIQQGITIGGNSSSAYVAAADLDGDGKPDLIVTDSVLNTVSALRNTMPMGSQSASFDAPLVLNTGSGPLMCAAVDLNGDNRLDLVVADNTDNSVSVFLNTTSLGVMSFSGGQVFAVGANPRSVIAADVDGDGRPDLVVGYDAITTIGVSVLRDKTAPAAASASFATQRAFGVTGRSYYVASGDLDADGRTDVVAEDGDNVVVFLGTTTPGGGPTNDLSATTLTFGDQRLGTTGPAQSVTLSNNGNQTLNANISISGPYAIAQGSSCGSSLPADQDCLLSVVFMPNTMGSQSGSITVTSNAADSPRMVTLVGNGIQALAALSETNLTFSDQAVGTTSAAQALTVTNNGNQALSFTVNVNGPYAQSNTCNGAVAPSGGTCTLSVTFIPTVPGTQTGSITLTDNAADSPQTVTLSGLGLAALADLSAPSLNFASQNVGTTSTAMVLTLTNNGNITLSIAGIAATGPYTQTNTCGSNIVAGGNCTISVTFAPTSIGAANGSLTLTDNAGDSPQTVALSGTGTGAIISLLPAIWDFGNVVLGTSPNHSKNFTLQNTGNVTLNITSIAKSGLAFQEADTCGSTLAAGAPPCTITVTFAPSTAGAKTGSVTVNSDAVNNVPPIDLAGTATQAAADLSYPGSPNPINFGPVNVNDPSVGRTVTLKNIGTATMTSISVSLSGGQFGAFTEADACSSLAVNAHCTITVHFTPGSTGAKTTNLHFTYKLDATGTIFSHNIELDGTGVTSGGGNGCPPPPLQCQ